MQNPRPIGWQRAVDLNMIDCCEWDKAQEQENDLLRFIHANFQLISKFFNSISIQHVFSDDKIEEKLKIRNQKWFESLAEHRKEELEEMKRCFESDIYDQKRKTFVYH